MHLGIKSAYLLPSIELSSSPDFMKKLSTMQSNRSRRSYEKKKTKNKLKLLDCSLKILMFTNNHMNNINYNFN